MVYIHKDYVTTKVYAMRNFITVANKVVEEIKYQAIPYKTHRFQSLMNSYMIVKAMGGYKPHIVIILFEKLCDLDKNIMRYEEYLEFTTRLTKIKYSGIYLPPDNHSSLWEKFAELCAIHIGKYSHTDWAMKISRIVRDVE